MLKAVFNNPIKSILAPQSSQWVPLETISTDVVKNGSTTTFVSTTSQISVENVTESNINIPVILPVNSTEEFNTDNEEEEVELTTILPPVDEPSPVGQEEVSDNTTSTTTKAPSIFPSLEGVDYRQSKLPCDPIYVTEQVH